MLRFTIRDLVLLTLAVALGVGWWLDRSSLASHAEQLARHNVALAAEVEKEKDHAEQAWRILTHTVDATVDAQKQ